MNLSNDQREAVERALDDLWDLVRDHCDGMPLVKASASYLRAIAIVREVPPGERRVRSDFLRKRLTSQGEMTL